LEPGLQLDRKPGSSFLIKNRRKGNRVIKGVNRAHQPESVVEGLRRKVSFQVLGRNFELESEPSLFSKDDLDIGTRVLLESVDLTSFRRLLDVGCGWGAVGIVAATVNPEGEVIMTDVDRRAVKVAKENTERLGLEDRVKTVATDDIYIIPGNFDLILSNPPFHADTGTLTGIFQKARSKLEKRGELYLVVEKTYLQKLQGVLILKLSYESVSKKRRTSRKSQGTSSS
jgi:16S rRNA (guanine1207-N2)-methyltransferase